LRRLIKFQSKKKRRGKAKAAEGPSATPAASSEGLLIKAKKVAESLGGVEEARKAMDALVKLMG